MELLEELSRYALRWPETLRANKEEGYKIVGYTGRYVPEELIYAAGAFPHLICRGGEPEAPEAALPYLLRYCSPFARAQIGYYILGADPVVNGVGVDLIAAECSDAGGITRLADTYEYFKLPVMKIGVPQDRDRPFAQDYYRRKLIRLKEKLEELTGNKISDEKLRESIDKTNKIRSLLNKISELRKEHPPSIGGYDFIRLNHYSFYCDRDIMAKKLEDLREELKKAEKRFPEEAPRILLAGHVIAFGDYVVPRLIEEHGAVIVDEFLDHCTRMYRWNVKTDGDLIKNLADRYFLDTPPITFMEPSWRTRLEYMEKLIKDFNVDGVVWYQLVWEEIYNLECSILMKRMKELDIPVLKLGSSYEYSVEAMGPLRTRIESFIEEIRRRKK